MDPLVPPSCLGDCIQQISDSETFKRQSPILRTETSPETSQNSRRLGCWSCACGGCARGSRRCGCPRCHSSLSSRSGTKLGDCSARFLSISSTHSFQTILTLRFKEFQVQQDTDEIFISKFAASQAFCSFWTMAAWLRLCMVLLESSILTPASLMTRIEPGVQEIKRKWIGLMNVGCIWLYLKIGDHMFLWFSITFPYWKLPCYQIYSTSYTLVYIYIHIQYIIYISIYIYIYIHIQYIWRSPPGILRHTHMACAFDHFLCNGCVWKYTVYRYGIPHPIYGIFNRENIIGWTVGFRATL